ncbi:MAG: 23S rRNA (uracil(1939)-C(5))-methyltransferase RlmD [Desulfovibrio sp.]
MTLAKGEVVKLTIESLAFGGKGVARTDGMVIFVEGALPGQTVNVELTKVKKRFAEGGVVEVLEKSEHEVEPFCPYFGRCGGCSLQHLDYSEQLKQKGMQVRDTVRRLGGLDEDFLISPPVASPETKAYRNKMEFAFSGGNKSLALGLRSKGGHKLIDVGICYLMTETAVSVVNAARHFLKEAPVHAWDKKKNKGFLRHLVIRHTGVYSENMEEEIMVHVITSPSNKLSRFIRSLGAQLMSEFPQVRSFVHSIRRSRTDFAFGEEVSFVVGEDHVHEELKSEMEGMQDVRYRVSPDSFFQTNTLGASKLYAAIGRMAGLSGKETVYDLYSGSGGISLYLASKAERVIGLENVKSAVKDARMNATMNEITNCEFHHKDLAEIGALEGLPKPDVVVCDPPRNGLSEEVIERIRELKPAKLVLVSCNPATLGRDAAALKDYYKPSELQAVDLFPHTPHVEAVLALELRADVPETSYY